MFVRIFLTLLSLLCELSLLLVDGIVTPILIAAGLAVSAYHWISHSASLGVIVNRITGCDLPENTLLPDLDPVRTRDAEGVNAPHPLMFLTRTVGTRSPR